MYNLSLQYLKTDYIQMKKTRIDIMPVTKATYLESANQSLIQLIKKVILKDNKSNVIANNENKLLKLDNFSSPLIWLLAK